MATRSNSGSRRPPSRRVLPPLAGLLIAFLAAAAETPPPHPAPGKMIDLGGYRVHLNCAGQDGPTVMIVGAGYSFDWSLVQPPASAFARVCTYDPPGSVWSDPGPAPTCDGRVTDIHRMLSKAGIQGPVVLVGHSIGAVFARLYAERYPKDVAGMVLIDHAGAYRFTPGDAPLLPPPGPGSRLGPAEDSLERLPPFAREMHRWLEARNPSAPSNIPFFNSCMAEAAKITRAATAESMPLIVMANSALAGSSDYRSKQAELLAQSRNSKSMVATRSRGHSVPMDDPGSIIEAIRQVVIAARNHSNLQ